jgi:general secretion pathway protein K
MRRHRGVALIIALLLVAIGTLVVAAMIDDGEMAMARTRNLLREQQAYSYARGLEAYAIEVLRRDQADGDPVDSRQDVWANALPPTDVPGGKIAGRLSDMNGCLNVNRLVQGSDVNAVERQRWDRLLQILKLDIGLTEAIIDWVDSDSTPLPRGAEDLSYLLLTPPYRAGNQPMRHVSELRLVRGIDAEVFAALEPHVCAAPADSALNVNTASLQVLMSLAPEMSEVVARRLYNEGRARYDSVDMLLSQLREAGLDPGDGSGLSVASSRFLAESVIDMDGIEIAYFSVIERKPAQPLQVVARSRGSF